MRIYSKEKDYYDFFQEEDGIVWHRKNLNQIQLAPNTEKFIKDLYGEMPRRYSIEPYNMDIPSPVQCESILMFFCGEVYTYYRLWRGYDLKPTFIMARTPNQLKDIVENRFKVNNVRWSSWRNTFSDEAMEDFLRMVETYKKRIYDIHIEHQVPYFMISNVDYLRKLSIEIKFIPLLKDFSFQSIVDPFTAYQKILFFMSNDLVSEPLNDFKMSDDLKRDSKGFDKWSFRKKTK